MNNLKIIYSCSFVLLIEKEAEAQILTSIASIIEFSKKHFEDVRRQVSIICVSADNSIENYFLKDSMNMGRETGRVLLYKELIEITISTPKYWTLQAEKGRYFGFDFLKLFHCATLRTTKEILIIVNPGNEIEYQHELGITIDLVGSDPNTFIFIFSRKRPMESLVCIYHESQNFIGGFTRFAHQGNFIVKKNLFGYIKIFERDEIFTPNTSWLIKAIAYACQKNDHLNPKIRCYSV